MILGTLGSLLFFALLSFGPGWLFAARLAGTAAERLLASVVLSWLAIFFVAWAAYVCALPLATLWVLPALALAGLAAGWRPLRDLWGEAEARELVLAQAIVTAWCVGWLALVISYSGGRWIGDWVEHWQRTLFFLERWPHGHRFIGLYALPARPPLANVATGALLALTKIDFAHYQLAMTALGSLCFLPAAVLARRLGAGRATAALALLCMASPMFVQNATFAWTKLHAAFLILAAAHYFLRAGDADPRRAGLWCAASLAAALLTHYSAGPYAVVIAAAWMARGWARRREGQWWRETLGSAALGAAVLAGWFGWALAHYGARGTFLTNTSVTGAAATAGQQLMVVLLNLRDTLVPHFLRPVDYSHIAQASAWGGWRDRFFQLYQLNLMFAFGSVGWLAVTAALLRCATAAPAARRLGWGAAIAAIVILGVAVHATPDMWGVAHICLVPLVLAGLAFLAANLSLLSRGWHVALAAGATVDLACGIVLHFAMQGFLIDQWLAPGRPAAETIASYPFLAGVNLNEKLRHGRAFLGDGFVGQDSAILLLLAALLALAVWRAARDRSA